jgi:hypothetical protein
VTFGADNPALGGLLFKFFPVNSLAKFIGQNLYLFVVKLKNLCSKFLYNWRILLLSGVNTLRYLPMCSDTVVAGMIFPPFTRSPNVVWGTQIS